MRTKQEKKKRNDGNRTRGPAGKEPRDFAVPPGQRRTSAAPGVDWRSSAAQGGGGRRKGKGKRRHEVEEDFEEEHYLGGQPMYQDDDHDGSGDDYSEEEANESDEEQNYEGSHGYGQTQAQYVPVKPQYAPVANYSPSKKRPSKMSQAISPSAQFKAQLAQKDQELDILRQQLKAMQDALKAIQEQQKAPEKAPDTAEVGKKKAVNGAMNKRIRDVVLQKVSKTHPFVPSAKYVGQACDYIAAHLDVPELLGDSKEAISNRKDFTDNYGESCCKAFNHARTYVQQQVRKEIMILLKGSQNWDQEVPTSEEIKEMCLRTYDLTSDESQKKALFFLDKLLPACARGRSLLRLICCFFFQIFLNRF